eukprot:CAMPEP_0173381854 /NCGR_PEP_ID=MMETSP1356-20130122/4292_1 /TAXON_ID=77927 ORGANISM="Hemiselmis virescens, Strain PCC157" /NCGR_SAMPLE_ID=MMETSP1356 /ASSEMBLY_ACC=CAM_ASM_000847 /LENGTH=229 /DNA_ID=CAMNT_0014335897 /DNA_START=225 /DNA_END=914 /DNA_ORIENTATION=-
MKIVVQLDDGQMFETVAKSSDTLEAVKDAVERQTQVPANRQKLFFGGSELKHGETLAHCLWESLKKVSTKDTTGEKIDLRTVKMLCSPAGSPNRGLSPTRWGGMSPTRSSMNMDSVLRACPEHGDSTTSDTLEEAAHRLGDKALTDRNREVSPERRAATEKLAAQYGHQSPSLRSPTAERSQSFDNPLVHAVPDQEQNPDVRSPGPAGKASSPRPGDEGFSGYHDDMIL